MKAKGVRLHAANDLRLEEFEFLEPNTNVCMRM